MTSPIEREDRRSSDQRRCHYRAMARSKREIPHYYLSTTIDMGWAMAWLKDENLKRSVTDRLLYGVLLIKAVALALRQVPELNALWKGGAAVQSPDIHVGVAVSLRQGSLVAPAIHDTDKQGLGKLMTRFQDLVKRARAGILRSSEFSDPTITVTSLGEQGAETVFGVIIFRRLQSSVSEKLWNGHGGVDSMDFLDFAISIHKTFDVEIQEADYPKYSTLNGCVEQLSGHRTK